MKRIQINAGTVGLVYKRGDYQRVLKPGLHWLGFNETVQTLVAGEIKIVNMAKALI